MKDKEKLEKALRDYRLSFWLVIPRLYKPTDKGLCHYFNEVVGIDTMPDILKEVAGEMGAYEGSPITDFWFPAGQLRNRIKILKETLRRLKNDK